VSTDSGQPARRGWIYLATTLVTGGLLYVLAPVLTPFAAGALLAYLGDPLVDRLEARKISRTVGVIIVFVLLSLAVIATALFLLPLLEQQIRALVHKVPGYLDWAQNNLWPQLASTLGVSQDVFSFDAVKQAMKANWQSAGGVFVGIVTNISQSGLAALAWIGNLVLVPVVTFYLLRDWDILVGRLRALLPRANEANVVRIVKECDDVLAEFFRGQLLVMAVLALVYSVGLSIVGLDLALLIGMVAGLVSFVPYLGLLVGIVLAGIAAFFQFHEFLPIAYVAAVFGVGQALEGMVLTPMLVGDRIGLHPVAVIFAVLAGAQLFGFLGVLLALPVAAVVVVLLRNAHERYVKSEIYQA